MDFFDKISFSFAPIKNVDYDDDYSKYCITMPITNHFVPHMPLQDHGESCMDDACEGSSFFAMMKGGEIIALGK